MPFAHLGTSCSIDSIVNTGNALKDDPLVIFPCWICSCHFLPYHSLPTPFHVLLLFSQRFPLSDPVCVSFTLQDTYLSLCLYPQWPCLSACLPVSTTNDPVCLPVCQRPSSACSLCSLSALFLLLTNHLCEMPPKRLLLKHMHTHTHTHTHTPAHGVQTHPYTRTRTQTQPTSPQEAVFPWTGSQVFFCTCVCVVSDSLFGPRVQGRWKNFIWVNSKATASACVLHFLSYFLFSVCSSSGPWRLQPALRRCDLVWFFSLVLVAEVQVHQYDLWRLSHLADVVLQSRWQWIQGHVFREQAGGVRASHSRMTTG